MLIIPSCPSYNQLRREEEAGELDKDQLDACWRQTGPTPLTVDVVEFVNAFVYLGYIVT